VEPFPFQFFGRYFWAIAIGISLINYVIGRRRIVAASGLNEIQQSETLGRFGRLYLLSDIPWLVMGWGVLFGGVPSVFSFFRPQDHNPYVTYWYGSLLLLAVVNALWIMLADVRAECESFSSSVCLARGKRTPPRLSGPSNC